jgi:hypothetical protein
MRQNSRCTGKPQLAPGRRKATASIGALKKSVDHTFDFIFSPNSTRRLGQFDVDSLGLSIVVAGFVNQALA